ncbi:MAG: sigma 54-interacting transcriptional regulator [Spirochaetia bacterium]
MLADAKERKRLETLIEINTLINSKYTDPRALLTRIIESATKLTEGAASSLLLLNQENKKLYFEIALGSKGPDVKRFSLSLGEGIAGWVALHNTSLIVNDVDKDSRHYAEIGKQIGFPTRTLLAVPMRIKEQCVGVIEIINKKDGKYFTNDDLRWLEIFANQAALAIQNARSFQKVSDELSVLQDKVNKESGYHTFIGKSPIIMEKLEVAKKIALTDSSVLLLGESGVGKELFAEQIHLHSPRTDKPLIRVNCAALPEHLLESELFGHVKGAFTDAVKDRRGRFELADGGTIFLDEIGEVPVALQTKLLRVIENKIFEKVGSSESIKVDVRIIAATNKNLAAAIEEGSFRTDLYYRLNVLPLEIPPLRQRKEDILELADFFLKRSNNDVKKQVAGFTDEAVEIILSYDWPGNVRELENVIERSVVMCSDTYITSKDLFLVPSGEGEIEKYCGKTLKEALNLFKKHYIKSTLESCNWVQKDAAEALDIQRTYLSRLIKDYSIHK